MNKINIEHILPMVTKPARYTGGEINSVSKDIPSTGVRIALAFPDVYEIGMSHLGLKILYEILNDLPDVAAERVYAPWLDMEERLRNEGIPLFGLESKTPLSEFDVIGFSLQYELSYTNVLNMLQLSNIPLLSKERDEKHPLIIAGGPCSLNPEPLADFIDIFCIGEAEELIVEIVSTVKSHRDKSRHEMLLALSQIESVYVPSFYSVDYHQDGSIKGFIPQVEGVPLRIKRRVVDLEQQRASIKPIVPFIEIAHDRAGLEIQRGCGRGCRFCQAGFIYRPLRERSLNTLLKQSQQIIKETGYEELSLGSLSSTDYPDILDLVKGIERCFGRKLAISLPSLRLNSLVTEVSAILSRIKKTGLTIAPEAGTKRLSCVINKDVLDYCLPAIIKDAYHQGWKTVKLYFMIGLPTETWEDIEGIVSLVNSVRYGKKQLKISIASFVPKSHTPFQWEAQESIVQLREKLDYIKRQFQRCRWITITWNDPATSFLEAVFARGDRRLGQVLLYALEQGCKFDAWSEYFKFSVWMDAFKRAGISPEFYTDRKSGKIFEDHLPWDHIDTGVNKEYLIKEAKRAYEGVTTDACQIGKCKQCGACETEIQEDAVRQTPVATYLPPSARGVVEGRQIRVRLKYTKGKEVSFVSHLDMLRMFMRSLSRAGIPIAYSSGYSPHPRLSFGHPLSVGVMSQEEFLDIELEMPMNLDELIIRLNEVLPVGIKISDAVFIASNAGALTAIVDFIRYQVDGYGIISLDDITSFMNKTEVVVQRKRKDTIKQVNIREFVRGIEVRNTECGMRNAEFQLMMEIKTTNSGTGKPEEVVHALCPDASITSCIRIAQCCEVNGRILSPMEIRV
ncbi:MAG: TIGR03960 family B12-binding radical SAM protein [bacterium]|nr:TIGR03960 family B12-binding radical SAM protein [bacterium]